MGSTRRIHAVWVDRTVSARGPESIAGSAKVRDVTEGRKVDLVVLAVSAPVPAIGHARWVGKTDAAGLQGAGGPGQLVTRLLSTIIGISTPRPSDLVEGKLAIPLPGTDETVVAIPAPGHTRGSMVYLFRGVLFAGDALEYRNGRLELPSEHFADSAAEVRDSIARLPSLVGDAPLQLVCTGHGGCTPPATARALLAELIARTQAR